MLNRLKANLAGFFRQADLVLLGLCCAATVFGIVMIYSATNYKDNTGRYVLVQTVAMLLGVGMYIFLSLVDLERIMKKWWLLAVFNLVFIGLLLTPFGIGGEEYGNNAWLKFPGIPFSIGPAEVVKISFTLLLAKQLDWLRNEKHDLRSFRSALFVAGHTLLLMGYYVVISGDMGNALVFFFIFLAMTFVAGIALRWFALLLAGCGVGFGAAWLFDLIPGYMRDRFIVLFDHSYKPLETGWQQSRSLLTLGSGGWFGQGYLKGTQTQSASDSSLPYRWTDFIFSVIGEELGLVGCLAVILLLLAIIIRVLLISKQARTSFYSYVCIGMAAMLIFQMIINLGMCLFVMPTIGITLPFFSYGGSSIVTLFAAMGVVSGIKMRSHKTRRPGRPL